MLENLDVAKTPFFPLFRGTIVSVEFGPLAVEDLLVLFACFQLNQLWEGHNRLELAIINSIYLKMQLVMNLSISMHTFFGILFIVFFIRTTNFLPKNQRRLINQPRWLFGCCTPGETG